jgi:hypothetical protein
MLAGLWLGQGQGQQALAEMVSTQTCGNVASDSSHMLFASPS